MHREIRALRAQSSLVARLMKACVERRETMPRYA